MESQNFPPFSSKDRQQKEYQTGPQMNSREREPSADAGHNSALASAPGDEDAQAKAEARVKLQKSLHLNFHGKLQRMINKDDALKVMELNDYYQFIKQRSREGRSVNFGSFLASTAGPRPGKKHI